MSFSSGVLEESEEKTTLITFFDVQEAALVQVPSDIIKSLSLQETCYFAISWKWTADPSERVNSILNDCRKQGARFVWLDRLCLDQNSPDLISDVLNASRVVYQHCKVLYYYEPPGNLECLDRMWLRLEFQRSVQKRFPNLQRIVHVEMKADGEVKGESRPEDERDLRVLASELACSPSNLCSALECTGILQNLNPHRLTSDRWSGTRYDDIINTADAPFRLGVFNPDDIRYALPETVFYRFYKVVKFALDLFPYWVQFSLLNGQMFNWGDPKRNKFSEVHVAFLPKLISKEFKIHYFRGMGGAMTHFVSEQAREDASSDTITFEIRATHGFAAFQLQYGVTNNHEISLDQYFQSVFDCIASTYTLEDLKVVLQNPRFARYLDHSKLEAYIQEDEFVRVFGMSSESFRALPLWKQAALKKENVSLKQLDDYFKISPGAFCYIPRVFTFEELRLALHSTEVSKGIQHDKLDFYVRDDEFTRVFGMNRESFQALPKWSQIALKKEKGVF